MRGIVNETIGELPKVLPYSLDGVARDGRPGTYWKNVEMLLKFQLF
jgi:hypothetical protein